MKNKFIHNFALMLMTVLTTFIFSGCGLVAMLVKTEDLKRLDLTTAYKYRDETTKSISVGMTASEVIEAWGKPNHIYNLDEYKLAKAQGKIVVDAYDCDEADEDWIYALAGKEPPLFGKEFSYEIYFKGDKVIKIIENEWTHRLIGPGDL